MALCKEGWSHHPWVYNTSRFVYECPVCGDEMPHHGVKTEAMPAVAPTQPMPAVSDRPTWPETWMTVARTMAMRSYDPRLKVGAILVPEDNTGILAQGYNGNYRGGPNQAESLEPGQSGMIHAEVNCLIKAPFHFPLRKHLYVTHSTCRQCAKLVINANVARVVYGELYRDESGLDLLRSAGVEVMSLPDAVRLALRA